MKNEKLLRMSRIADIAKQISSLKWQWEGIQHGERMAIGAKFSNGDWSN